jgi:hypothetical protein
MHATHTFRSLATFVSAATLMMVTGTAAAGQKPAPKADNNWYCSFKFYDRVPDGAGMGPYDVIRSDGKGSTHTARPSA